MAFKIKIPDTENLSVSIQIPVESLKKVIKSSQQIEIQGRNFSDQMAKICSQAIANTQKTASLNTGVNRMINHHTDLIESLIANAQKQFSDLANIQDQLMRNASKNLNKRFLNFGNIGGIAENFAIQNEELHATIQSALAVLAEHQIEVPEFIFDEINRKNYYENLDFETYQHQSSEGKNKISLNANQLLSVLLFLISLIWGYYSFKTLHSELEAMSQKIDGLENKHNDSVAQPIYPLSRLMIISKSATLQNGPSSKADSLIELKKNELVQVFEEKDEWIEVAY